MAAIAQEQVVEAPNKSLSKSALRRQKQRARVRAIKQANAAALLHEQEASTSPECQDASADQPVAPPAGHWSSSAQGIPSPHVVPYSAQYAQVGAAHASYGAGFDPFEPSVSCNHSRPPGHFEERRHSGLPQAVPEPVYQGDHGGTRRQKALPLVNVKSTLSDPVEDDYDHPSGLAAVRAEDHRMKRQQEMWRDGMPAHVCPSQGAVPPPGDFRQAFVATHPMQGAGFPPPYPVPNMPNYGQRRPANAAEQYMHNAPVHVPSFFDQRGQPPAMDIGQHHLLPDHITANINQLPQGPPPRNGFPDVRPGSHYSTRPPRPMQVSQRGPANHTQVADNGFADGAYTDAHGAAYSATGRSNPPMHLGQQGVPLQSPVAPPPGPPPQCPAVVHSSFMERQLYSAPSHYANCAVDQRMHGAMQEGGPSAPMQCGQQDCQASSPPQSRVVPNDFVDQQAHTSTSHGAIYPMDEPLQLPPQQAHSSTSHGGMYSMDESLQQPAQQAHTSSSHGAMYPMDEPLPQPAQQAHSAASHGAVYSMDESLQQPAQQAHSSAAHGAVYSMDEPRQRPAQLDSRSTHAQGHRQNGQFSLFQSSSYGSGSGTMRSSQYNSGGSSAHSELSSALGGGSSEYHIKNTFIESVDVDSELAALRANAARFHSLQPANTGLFVDKMEPPAAKEPMMAKSADTGPVTAKPQETAPSYCVRNTFIEAVDAEAETPRASAVRFSSMQHVVDRPSLEADLRDVSGRPPSQSSTGHSITVKNTFIDEVDSEAVALRRSATQFGTVPGRIRSSKLNSLEQVREEQVSNTHSNETEQEEDVGNDVDLASMFRGLIQSEIGKVAKATQKS